MIEDGYFRTCAMWEVAYLRVSGTIPVPFKHLRFRDYAADLQRQRTAVQQDLTPAEISVLRQRTRGIVRKLGLETVTAGYVPARVPSLIAADSDSKVAPGRPSNSSVKRCRRKIRHGDYLSASLHASSIDDGAGLRIYPCSTCDGLHVGHDEYHFGLKRIAEAERQLTVLDLQRSRLQQRLNALLANQEGLLRAQRHDEAGIHLDVEADTPGGSGLSECVAAEAISLLAGPRTSWRRYLRKFADWLPNRQATEQRA